MRVGGMEVAHAAQDDALGVVMPSVEAVIVSWASAAGGMYIRCLSPKARYGGLVHCLW